MEPALALLPAAGGDLCRDCWIRPRSLYITPQLFLRRSPLPRTAVTRSVTCQYSRIYAHDQPKRICATQKVLVESARGHVTKRQYLIQVALVLLQESPCGSRAPWRSPSPEPQHAVRATRAKRDEDGGSAERGGRVRITCIFADPYAPAARRSRCAICPGRTAQSNLTPGAAGWTRSPCGRDRCDSAKEMKALGR